MADLTETTARLRDSIAKIESECHDKATEIYNLNVQKLPVKLAEKELCDLIKIMDNETIRFLHFTKPKKYV